MFLSDKAHAHLLAPGDYSAPDVFAQEQRDVFAKTWQVACARGELDANGAQIALMVGGEPVLVRNDHGEVRAYRNVCAHRHSMLAPLGKSCKPTLQCMYHGWEYAPDGKLSHLPDGQSFNGWKAKGVRLGVIRCEVAWGLVFVNVAPGASTLRDDFGAIAGELDAHMRDTVLHYTQLTEHDANWKVVVENAVEGYHVPMVHQSTFGSYASEQGSDHVIEASYTQFHDVASRRPPHWQTKLIDQVMFRASHHHGYSHTHIYPNHLVTWSGFYREWVVAEPLGPRRTRRRAYGFFPADLRTGNPLWRLAMSELVRRTDKISRKILGEDSSLWESVQRGTEASQFAGVLGAREERVASFQRWLVAQRATTR